MFLFFDGEIAWSGLDGWAGALGATLGDAPASVNVQSFSPPMTPMYTDKKSFNPSVLIGDIGGKRIRRSRMQIHFHFPAVHPPSRISVDPVTKADSSLARYTAAAAISSGFPIRRSACVAAISSYAFFGSGYSLIRCPTQRVS